MPQDSVEIVLATWTALAESGVDGMLEHVREDFETLMQFTLATRGRATGPEAAIEATALCDVADGKVSRLVFFPAWDQALEAAR